jgi:hypothetical protein
VGSRSVHFRSLAGMKMGALAPAFGALFAFASPDPCARTAVASTNDAANARMFLALIEPSFFRSLAPRLSYRAALSSRPIESDESDLPAAKWKSRFRIKSMRIGGDTTLRTRACAA